MLRATIFHAYFWPSQLAILIIFGLPALFNQTTARLTCKLWARNFIFAAKQFHHINYEITGNLSAIPAIYAVKHQSLWETFLLHSILTNPTFILKKELVTVPIIGAILTKAGHIAVDRKNPAKALKTLVGFVKAAITNGSNVIIFPEGTRTLPGVKSKYKQGISLLYKNLPEVQIIPVSLNSGSFWTKGSFVKKPGRIDINFHQPIAKNLTRNDSWPC